MRRALGRGAFAVVVGISAHIPAGARGRPRAWLSPGVVTDRADPSSRTSMG